MLSPTGNPIASDLFSVLSTMQKAAAEFFVEIGRGQTRRRVWWGGRLGPDLHDVPAEAMTSVAAFDHDPKRYIGQAAELYCPIVTNAIYYIYNLGGALYEGSRNVRSAGTFL